MKLSYFKKTIAPLTIFNKDLLRNLEEKPANLDANLKYWLKKGDIISLKKGSYILRDTYNKIPADDILEYIANQLVQPSYLSLEYILAKYQLLTEPVRAITSVSTKKTTVIKNKISTFRYYSIAPALFTGYFKKQKNNLTVWEARKSKALFDFLYLRFFKKVTINTDAVDALRINWENVSKAEFKEMFSYLSLTNNQRTKKILAIIKDKYYA